MPDIQLITSQSQSGSKNVAMKKAWNIAVSPSVSGARNPIRGTLASITGTPPSTSKAIINLGLGDPTFYPLHPPPSASITATCRALQGESSNGYVNGVGSIEARRAVADYHQNWDGVSYDPSNIVLTHGVGQALDLVFSVLVPHHSHGPSNVLVPKPGFSQYSSLLTNLGPEIRHYNCLEERGWEVDIKMLNSMIDDNTRAIILTNPSNPCGSNYSKEHLQQILEVAERHKVIVIADEIYGHMTWNKPFIPLASLSDSVPIITLSGLSKRFLLPGWRVGWAALHDPQGVAVNVAEGMATWGNRFFGPSSVVQAALPEILLSTPDSWFAEVTQKIKLNAEIMYDCIDSLTGVHTTRPEGALYMLVRIAPGEFDLRDDVEFCTAFYKEEAVFLLPGMCFEAPGYVRVVLATPADVTQEVVSRLQAFCLRHRIEH